MQVTLQNLSQPDHDKLVNWLNEDAFEVLERVINSKVFALQAKASTAQLDAVIRNADDDAPPFKVSASDMREAADLSRVLNVLKQMRDTKAPFQFATATP